MASSAPRIARLIGAVDMGSFRISAMVAGLTEAGEIVVLGAGHRASQGIRRGYVTDMTDATYAVRDAIDRAEKMAGASVSGVWIGCSGAGLASRVHHAETEIGGRHIETDDIEHLLVAARDSIEPDGRSVLHAQPAHYTLDGAYGVRDPKGLNAERLGVDIHVMLADGAPVRNLTETVQKAHLDVEAVVASPFAAAHACLGAEERELGVALLEFGGGVTNLSVHHGGMLVGLVTLPIGSADITDAIATSFGIRRFQAERLKCVSGSAIATPADHRELLSVAGPGEPGAGEGGNGQRIPRAELISVITAQLDRLMDDVGRALKALGYGGQRGQQVVLTGGGAELAGLADYAQNALGRPVRLGKPPAIRGLAEAHQRPGFATLAGLVLGAAADPVDIRAIRIGYQPSTRYSGSALVARVMRAMKEYF